MNAPIETQQQQQQQYEAPAATQAEHVAQWARVDAFFSLGFLPGEDVYVCTSNGLVFPGVYLCDRAGKAGVALLSLRKQDPYVPASVEYSQVTIRLDTPRYNEEEV